MMKSKMKAMVIAGGLLAMSATQAQADTTVDFSGTLVIPPCTINGGTAVAVPFGNVNISDLATVRTAYNIQTATIPMNCPYNLGTPTLTVSAMAATGSATAAGGIISTSKDGEGLGVFLLQQDGTTAVPLNAAANVTSSVTGTGATRTLTLKAGVGQLNGMSALTAGAFNATASLNVVYQ